MRHSKKTAKNQTSHKPNAIATTIPIPIVTILFLLLLLME